MNLQPFARVRFVGNDDLLSKRYIADGKIERCFWKLRRFKALLCNRGFRIGDSCDACRKRIEFNAADTAVLANFLRHRSKESSGSAARFEDISTVKAEMLETCIDSLGNFRRRVIGIENGRARGIVFCLRELLAECIVLFLPAAVFGVENSREPSEATVGTEKAQFVLIRRASRPFQLFHYLDGREISHEDSTFATRGREVCLVIDGREVYRRF